MSLNQSTSQSIGGGLSSVNSAPSPLCLSSSIGSDDNNPFDVTENKDYFKSQDVEIKQLIINVLSLF